MFKCVDSTFEPIPFRFSHSLVRSLLIHLLAFSLIKPSKCTYKCVFAHRTHLKFELFTSHTSFSFASLPPSMPPCRLIYLLSNLRFLPHACMSHKFIRLFCGSLLCVLFCVFLRASNIQR